MSENCKMVPEGCDGDTDKPRRELESAFQRGLDNLFNRVTQLEVVDKARKKAIDNYDARLNALEGKVINVAPAMRPEVFQFFEYPGRMQSLSLKDLVYAMSAGNMWPDQLLVELRRRLDEAKPSELQIMGGMALDALFRDPDKQYGHCLSNIWFAENTALRLRELVYQLRKNALCVGIIPDLEHMAAVLEAAAKDEVPK